MKRREMENTLLGTTLAYTGSRKTSKRTTFQDELHAAVSARAQKNMYEEGHRYSDDYEDDDDIFKELLSSSKLKKRGALKSEKNKSKINDFGLSDDEVENVKPKRVSFLKTKKTWSPTPLSEIGESPADGPTRSDHSPRSPLESKGSAALESSRWESPSPLLCDPGEDKLNTSIVGEEEPVPLPSEGRTTQSSFTGSIFKDEFPKPKPRQRTLRVSGNTEAVSEPGGVSPPEKPATSSVCVPLSATETDSPTERVFQSSSPQTMHGEDFGASPKFSADASSETELLCCSPHKSADGSLSTENKEENSQDEEDTADGSQCNTSRESRATEKTSKTRERPSSSHSARPQMAGIIRPQTAESRYLGTLKVLDHKVCIAEPQANSADSLRATVYQEWLKVKNQKMKETLRMKRQEENILAEKKMQETLAKKGEAKVSFEAWKEKKADLIKVKMREDQEAIKKQQMELEGKEEKRQAASQAFEKWKMEQDKHLKEKRQKEKLCEAKLKQKQVEDAEARRRENTSAFAKWSEKKKQIIEEKVKMECREKKIKEEEETYEQEEKGRMALEVYEKWLRRKERQKRRERQQKRIDSILRETPPPPWSPPSKTVPSGK